VLNIIPSPEVARRLQLGLYCAGALAALVMGIVGAPDARLPWFIVALFCGGSAFDGFREDKTIR